MLRSPRFDGGRRVRLVIARLIGAPHNLSSFRAGDAARVDSGPRSAPLGVEPWSWPVRPRAFRYAVAASF
jgi:hypothetical protein